MAPPKFESAKKGLIVEGKTDLYFLAEFIEDIEQPPFGIKDVGGKSLFETNLETLLRPDLLASKECIGVIVDADGNGQATAKKFARLLSTITGQDVREGEWTCGKPSIGLLVVPAPTEQGEIEDVIWNAWQADPKNAAARGCIENYVTCMAEKAGTQAHSPVKGRLGALLALCNDDDPRIGPAAQANCFDFRHPGFDRMRSFLSFATPQT
jgi:5S rRNA maturation endonuclease (ribonuclease M5)